MPKKIAVLMFVLLALVACGGGASAPATEITLEETDFSFSPDTITVPLGKPVTLTITNGGVVEHDFGVQKIGVSDVSMGHEEGMSHDMGAMELDLHVATQPNGVSTITFTPTEAGEYEFFCSVPGHKEAGMMGKLTVIASDQ